VTGGRLIPKLLCVKGRAQLVGQDRDGPLGECKFLLGHGLRGWSCGPVRQLAVLLRRFVRVVGGGGAAVVLVARDGEPNV
jgi:hypothetical protein